MKLALLSDTHGYLPEIPECDIAIHAGDICPDMGKGNQVSWLRDEFYDWQRQQPAKDFVWIGGNHDFALAGATGQGLRSHLFGTYLNNESAEVQGVKIWGSPYSNIFGNWAFMDTDFELQKIWATIPDDTEILITHGPAYGIGDKVSRIVYPGEDHHVGSKSLTDRIAELPNLKLHVFGHIHEGFGSTQRGNVTHANVSYVTLGMEPRPFYDPIVIDI
jgi:Icc-related predicted phosphoesterase